MFRSVAIASSLAALAPLHAAAELPPNAPPLPGSHQEFIPALLELLSQTEQALASCTDASSVEAALPRLRELATQARELSARQQTLPEPTVQDYMAAHPHVAAFNQLWEAICAHIERLEQARLVTPELRSLLRLAPPAA